MDMRGGQTQSDGAANNGRLRTDLGVRYRVEIGVTHAQAENGIAAQAKHAKSHIAARLKICDRVAAQRSRTSLVEGVRSERTAGSGIVVGRRWLLMFIFGANRAAITHGGGQN